MGKELSLRQRRFVAGVIAGKTQTDSARDAGYRQPHVQGSTLFKRPQIREALEAAFEAEGLTPGYLAKKIKELSEASDTDEDGQETPNWTARGRGLDLLVRVTGADKHPDVTESYSFEEIVFRMHAEEFGPDTDTFGSIEAIDVGNGESVVKME